MSKNCFFSKKNNFVSMIKVFQSKFTEIILLTNKKQKLSIILHVPHLLVIIQR